MRFVLIVGNYVACGFVVFVALGSFGTDSFDLNNNVD